MEVRRSAELEELAEEGHQAFLRHDDDWMAAHTADGEVVSFGTDPAEIWRGREEVLGLTTEQIEELNAQAGLRYEREGVEGYEIGDAGFVISHGRFVLADGTGFATRGISFMVKDGDTWKTIAGGMSLLVRNELLTEGSPLAQAATTTA
jgi:SnoaL-like domain